MKNSWGLNSPNRLVCSLCGNTMLCWVALSSLLLADFLLSTLLSSLCSPGEGRVLLLPLAWAASVLVLLSSRFQPTQLFCANTFVVYLWAYLLQGVIGSPVQNGCLSMSGIILHCQNNYQDGVKNVGCRKIRKSYFCVVSCLFLFLGRGVSCYHANAKLNNPGCPVSELNSLSV